MAITPRRVFKWLLLAAAAVLLLAVLAVLALVLFVSPDRYKQNVEASLRDTLGREVRLEGALQWHLGRQISIESDDGRIANLPGFSAEPLARWQRLRFSVAAKPLLEGRQIVVDRIEIDGLQLNLERDAEGKANWQLGTESDNTAASTQGSTQIGAVALTNATLRFRDAATGADWQLLEGNASITLPADLNAPNVEFRDVSLQGLVKGQPLAPAGVAINAQLPALQVATAQDASGQGADAQAMTITIPSWQLQWAEARASGALQLQTGESLQASGKFTLTAPSLRTLLTTVKVTAPPTRDAKAFGALRASADWRYGAARADVENLELKLDDTTLQGKLELPKLAPLALRFDLSADQLDADRYLEPPEIKSEPFALPLAQLKKFDAKGVLRIARLQLAGATAQAVRVDVD